MIEMSYFQTWKEDIDRTVDNLGIVILNLNKKIIELQKEIEELKGKDKSA